ncbi:MAG: N-acetylmuramoyl-L-alanine amidase [Clostridia bacterium]|nr:N-acetylmuramoyl-L-alanine amidase [Clostridia bacterium]
MAVKIGLDPGHGGRDPGAVGPGGLQEKEVTLAVAGYLKEILVKAGFTVVVTRSGDQDVSLARRVEYLEAEKVELVLSLHLNSASTPEANYISSYILAPGGRAEKAAALLQKRLVEATGWPDGGVREANFYILRETSAPAVLVEMGFISNPEQEKALGQEVTQKLLAAALARGLAEFFGVELDAGNFPDIKGHWAEGAIRRVIAAGLMGGYPDGTFRPDQYLKRAELAMVLVKLLDRLPGGS